jgi:hypothetical protein
MALSGETPRSPPRALRGMPALCGDNGAEAISCREPSRFFCLIDRATEPRGRPEICGGAALKAMAAKSVARVARRNQRRWRLAPWATGGDSATNIYRPSWGRVDGGRGVNRSARIA